MAENLENKTASELGTETVVQTKESVKQEQSKKAKDPKAVKDSKKDKKDLIRIVKNKQNEINVDKTGKQEGRGAYICNNKEELKTWGYLKGMNRIWFNSPI